jgi:hypothetical protein
MDRECTFITSGESIEFMIETKLPIDLEKVLFISSSPSIDRNWNLSLKIPSCIKIDRSRSTVVLSGRLYSLNIQISLSKMMMCIGKNELFLPSLKRDQLEKRKLEAETTNFFVMHLWERICIALITDNPIIYHVDIFPFRLLSAHILHDFQFISFLYT